MERYQKQLTITTRIVALFDASENPDPKELMELMQEVRAAPHAVGIFVCYSEAKRALWVLWLCVCYFVRWVDARDRRPACSIAARNCTAAARMARMHLLESGADTAPTSCIDFAATGAQPGTEQRRAAEAAAWSGRRKLQRHVNYRVARR